MAADYQQDLDTLRAAVRFAVSRSSLRRVAAEIRMSPTGLTKFINGSSPYALTYRLLKQWYATQREAPSELRVDAALDAMGVLLADLPEAERVHAIESILDTLHLAHGPSEPLWLSALRHHLAQTPRSRRAARGPRGRRIKYEEG